MAAIEKGKASASRYRLKFVFVLGLSLVSCFLRMPMVSSNSFPLSDGRSLVSRLHRIDERNYAFEFEVSNGKFYFIDAINEWLENPDFGTWFCEALGSVEFNTFFWECPPVNKETVGSTIFECRIVKAHIFAPASPHDFRSYLHEGCNAVAFPNLGRSSMLVSPCPTKNSNHDNYGHLANFCRHATPEEHSLLWKTLASTFTTFLDQRAHLPIWLSTEGSGVPWLHLRLDPKPKYYKTSSFRNWPWLPS